jgi:hypothetical protein
MIGHSIRTDATVNSSKFLNSDGRPDGIDTSSGRMLLTEERLDALLSRLDGNLGSNIREINSEYLSCYLRRIFLEH